ncbi:MAG TPA: class II aldolase/adducin family protein [Acidimicrobiales bacterium]|jgi:L-fuculose-phosphate aldolase
MKEIRAAVLATAQELSRRGLVEGTSGNVSARVDDERVCMTPSSVPYETMTVDDLVVTDLEGKVLEGERSPTTERSLHLACYRAYPELGGVIHSHPVFATMFAVARQPIPAAIEEVTVYIGGDIPVCEYTMTGTDELGEAVALMLHDRGATLLANHGMVTVGSTVEKALHAALVVERTAHIVWGARQLGETHSVPAKVNEDFAGVYRFIREQRM